MAEDEPLLSHTSFMLVGIHFFFFVLKIQNGSKCAGLALFSSLLEKTNENDPIYFYFVGFVPLFDWKKMLTQFGMISLRGFFSHIWINVQFFVKMIVGYS